MGKDKKKQQQQQQETYQTGMADIGAQARNQYQNLFAQPSAVETELGPLSQNMGDLYSLTAGQQMQDYGDIMTGYRDFASGLKPTQFSYDKVRAKRPEELGEAYGYLREAMPGYRDFATTGGYSDTDIQELRARGIAPIRSAYGNTMMELNRARSLGGAGGAPNYIAAVSRANRELPGQMADAMTGVNAQLAQDIRQGKLAGLAGITGIGSEMGGLSSAEAGRLLQADLANQAADLQAQGMTEQSLQNMYGNQLAALSGQTGLYGTTPAMTNMFGNQVLNAYGQRAGLDAQRQSAGLGLLDAQMRALYNPANMPQQPQGTPWWQTALNVGSTVAPYVAQYYGGQKGIPMQATDIGGSVYPG